MSECNSEQDAARVLGHTQISWDNDSGRERQPASEDRDWSQLTDRQMAAALVLGYNQGMWDGLITAPQPDTANMGWSELMQMERAAAAALGYNQRSWDNESGSERQPSIENKDWGDLTGDEQRAATILGYDYRSWDGPQPDSVYKSWSDLTSCGKLSPIPYLSSIYPTCEDNRFHRSNSVIIEHMPAQLQRQKAQIKQMLLTNGTQSSGISIIYNACSGLITV